MMRVVQLGIHMHCMTKLGIARFWYVCKSLMSNSKFNFFSRVSRVSILIVVGAVYTALGSMVMSMSTQDVPDTSDKKGQ